MPGQSGKGWVSEMAQIAVLGDRESVLGFQALGLEVFPAETAEQACGILRRLERGGETAILYLTEQLAAQLPDELERCRGQARLAIVPIPGRAGSLGLGAAGVNSAVERAVGAVLSDRPADGEGAPGRR